MFHLQHKMKFFISILLLFITGLYILPVKEMLAKSNAVCMTDIDGEKEETEKKEKSKELFSFSNVIDILPYSCANIHQFVAFNIPVPLHAIETPPPDIV